MTDVLLYNTTEGGEIEYVNGVATTEDGLQTAVYLSLFGGNSEDSGLTADDAKQWWGNLIEDQPARKLRSETQHLLKVLPLIPGNLQRVRETVERDLTWLGEEGIVSGVVVQVTMPQLNRVAIRVDVHVTQSTAYAFTFDVNPAEDL